MSMRGIDAQLLITRSAELTKEAGRTQRSHEMRQEQLAEQARAQERRKQEQVQSAQELEASRIRERQGGQEGGQGKRQSGGRGNSEREPEGPERNPAPANRIDIKI